MTQDSRARFLCTAATIPTFTSGWLFCNAATCLARMYFTRYIYYQFKGKVRKLLANSKGRTRGASSLHSSLAAPEKHYA